MSELRSSRPAPKNWLLAKFRQWHKWGGLLAAAFLLVIGMTGILLNYKRPIFSALGVEQRGGKLNGGRGESASVSQLKITTGEGLTMLPTSLERALEIARAEWGDVAVERIEIASQRGELTWKLKQKDGGELWINAVTGGHFAKSEYERIGKLGADGVPARSTDWGKILIDLHTGKIGGEAGKAVMSAAALLLLLLIVSGIYLWLKPLLLKRRDARLQTAEKKSQASASPEPSPAAIFSR